MKTVMLVYGTSKEALTSGVVPIVDINHYIIVSEAGTLFDGVTAYESMNKARRPFEGWVSARIVSVLSGNAIW